MSSLSAVGSGLDIPTIVSQLVANERAPAENRINQQGTDATAKLSALGSIKSSLSSLQSALEGLGKSASTPSYKANAPEGSGFNATVSTGANAGSYDVRVISLATSQKLSSPAFGPQTAVGSGTLNLTWGTETLDVAIEEDSDLSAVAAAINRAAGGKGVIATVISADDGQHLVLNAVNAGTDGALKVSSRGGDGGLSALHWDGVTGNMSQTLAATDAKVVVDGFERSSSSNTITDLIPGVSLTLTKADEGNTKTLTITADNASLKSAIQGFVTAYNASASLLKSSSAYDATNNRASILTGDAGVRGLQQQMRNLVSANVVDLKDLGVTIAKDGTLSFTAAEFDKKIATSPDAATQLFAPSSRLGDGLSSLLKSNVDGSSGILTQRTDALNKQLKRLEKELDSLDLRMQKVSARYTAQFTAMDTLVAQMQGTSNYLSQQLASLASQNNS